MHNWGFYTTLTLFLSLAINLPRAASGEPDRARPDSLPAFLVTHERRGLPNFLKKLRAKRPVTVVYFGGSITEGAGASRADETSYRGRVGHWLQTTFPESAVTNINASIGGTGSDLGAFRLSRDVTSHKPDLVFVEYAVNDGGTPEAMIERSMEGIVRQIWRANRSTDICFIYTFVVGQMPDFRNRHLIRAVIEDEKVAEHYGIPSVNVAIPAARALIDGVMTNEQFSRDGVHPTDLGYEFYSDAIVQFLSDQFERDLRPTPHHLPHPLRPDSLDNTRMLLPDDIKPTGLGWQIETNSPVGQFPTLLVSNTPGAEQTAVFSGPILALFYVLGPDTGSFDYRIDDVAWRTMDPFDVFAKNYYRAHYRLLADGLTNTNHTIIFRIRSEHNPDSKGTFTRIGYLLENPPSSVGK